MEKKEYSVSEAVRLIGVESHVLRYWEEELQLEIRRTSQGHRVYSQENIETFRKVRDLKEHGLQLKAIRFLLEKTGGSRAKEELTEQIFEIGAGRRDREKSFAKTDDGHTQEDSAENGPEKQEADGEVFEKAPAKKQEEDGEIFEKNAAEKQDTFCEEGETDVVYDVALAHLPEKDYDKFRQFEEILKRIIGEIIEERNQRMELDLRRVLREELDQFFLLYQDIVSEAAAEREQETAKKGLFGRLRELLRR